jgi:hypothetical protein
MRQRYLHTFRSTKFQISHFKFQTVYSYFEESAFGKLCVPNRFFFFLPTDTLTGAAGLVVRTGSKISRSNRWSTNFLSNAISVTVLPVRILSFAISAAAA